MIVVVIPAKGASNRLPNKNMALINGRPMIDYAILDARASKRVDAIYVSTDCEAIAAHAEGLGVKVILRPESLGGEVPITEVYRHALSQLNDPDIRVIVGVQPDHPDRNVSVDEALAEFERAGADVLYSTEADGTKNGAHYIMSRRFLETGEAREPVSIVDDCTNVHYQEHLERAGARLLARSRAARQD